MHFIVKPHPDLTDEDFCLPLGLNGSVGFQQPKARCQILTEHK